METDIPQDQKSRVPASFAWSDDYILEHAYLVERGVRNLAIVDQIAAEPEGMLWAVSRLEQVAIGCTAIPFVIQRRDGFADCGFAAVKWVIDTYEWLVRSDAVPIEHEHRIRGLLLGYSSEAIRLHDDRSCGRRIT